MGKYGFSVFVGNLSRRVRRDDLKDVFRDCGRVLDVDIKTGYGMTHNIGYDSYKYDSYMTHYISAFVEFEERRDAEDAVKELNGIKVEGDRISVEMSKVSHYDVIDYDSSLTMTHNRDES